MKASTTLFIIFLLFANCNQNDEGKALYSYYCSNCHMDDGTGLQGLIPPLTNSDYLKNRPEDVPCIIKYGIKDSLLVNDVWYRSEMIGFSHFTDVDICNIINYIRNSWGNEAAFVAPGEVLTNLQACE